MASTGEIHAAQPFVDQLTAPLRTSAANMPHNVATIMGQRKRTWEELQSRVASLAAGLMRIGLKPGDRIAILGLNSDWYTEFLYATWWLGGCVVPINIRWSETEITYSLNDCGAKFLCVDATFASTGKKLLATKPELGPLLFIGHPNDAPAQAICLEDIAVSEPPIEDARRSGDDLAGIFYTGGTTGFPKGVMVSHASQCYTSSTLAVELGVSPNSVYLHAAPMFHVADAAAGGAAMSVGATNSYIPSFTPEGFMDAVAQDKVSHALLVPTMIGMMLGDAGFSAEKLASLEVLLYGASPMPRSIVESALEKMDHVALIQGYGQTESIPITVLPADYHVLTGAKAEKLSSAGRPAHGCEVKIVDEAGLALSNGAVGEIAVRSPGSMIGYWGRQDLTDETIIDGWVHTGDGGFIDDDGFVFIVDRIKDMIVSGGENVYSAEVESAISTHPSVAQVAIIGIPSEQWGEEVHAIVVPSDEKACTLEELVEHCRGRIANYKLPRSVSIRRDPLPISGAGKVLKRELRAPFWGENEKGVN